MLAIMFGFGAGCSTKTPEQIEADKYPKVKQMSPEEERAFRARMGEGVPVGAKGAPASASK